MTLDKLIVITGRPGIFEIVTQSKKGVIVNSLGENKKFPIHNIHNISSLNDISIYAEDQDILLKDIFKTIHKKEDGKPTISHKESKNKLIEFFLKILPNYDTERVYPSNIKKIIQWYNILVAAKFDFSGLDKLDSDEEE